MVAVSAYIIAAVIRQVLSALSGLGHGSVRIGWSGYLFFCFFAFVTWYCSTLQANCYSLSDPITGKRNYTCMEAVRTNLCKQLSCSCELLWSFCLTGGVQVQLYGSVQYANLGRVIIIYAIMVAISQREHVGPNNCSYNVCTRNH